MKKNQVLRLVWIGVLFLLVAGCGKSYPPVSGKVTLDGKPVENVSLMFVPESTEENPFPGPYAEGVTDAQGNFALVNRDGVSGGTPGQNIVEFYPKDTFELGFMQSEVVMLFAVAGGNTSHPSYKKAESLQKKIKSLQAMAAGTRIDRKSVV